jgi:spore coat polysaccharide biosynthesis protein SpsF (cytidylyltransferase family)
VDESTLFRVTRLPFRLSWDKEEIQPTLDAKQDFLLAYETMEETKQGVKMDNLPTA